MKSNDKPSVARLMQALGVRTTRRTELQDETDQVEAAVSESGRANRVCHLFVPHTTAGVIINEGYDPAVRRTSRRSSTVSFRASPIRRTRRGIPIRTLRRPWRVRQKQCGSSPERSCWAAGSGFSSPNLKGRAAGNCASRLFRMPQLKLEA